ncbi:MAG: phosphoribosylformylglycinamidine synthase subunit PurQ [Acidobacteria bacterium]|nr:phosphoribosylformylglycinamidine synthase subunit PurQ [Acidobacteriota bacterium]
MKVGVVVFPGSNCDHDTYFVARKVFDQQCVFLWHGDRTLQEVDVVILPGGFSYGDYLRCGAIAKFSALMEQIKQFAARGGLVFGICNGFQILQEAGLLPGVMLRNQGLKFICEHVHVRVERTDLPLTLRCRQSQVLRLPIAHNEGNFYADAPLLERLERNRQVVFRYCDSEGNVTDAANPNGSLHNIAGVANLQGNVFALMPHPERASEPALGSDDGKYLFQSLIQWVEQRVATTAV